MKLIDDIFTDFCKAGGEVSFRYNHCNFAFEVVYRYGEYGIVRAFEEDMIGLNMKEIHEHMIIQLCEYAMKNGEKPLDQAIKPPKKTKEDETPEFMILPKPKKPNFI